MAAVAAATSEEAKAAAAAARSKQAKAAASDEAQAAAGMPPLDLNKDSAENGAVGLIKDITVQPSKPDHQGVHSKKNIGKHVVYA